MNTKTLVYIKQNKIILYAIWSLASILAILFITNLAASAATRVWDGGGTGVEDGQGNWTYQINDAANWVGDVAPVNGDDLVFPMNFADTDPLNDGSNDANDFYNVNFATPITVNSILYQGSESDCGGLDDFYSFTGDFNLSGNIITDYFGQASFTSPKCWMEHRLGTITLESDSIITLQSTSTIDAGIYNITMCSEAGFPYTSPYNNQTYFLIANNLTGTGTLRINCDYFQLSNNNTVHEDITVGENSLLDVSGDLSFLKNPNRTITLMDGAQFVYYNFEDSAPTVHTLTTNFIFNGSGSSYELCTSNRLSDCWDDNTLYQAFEEIERFELESYWCCDSFFSYVPNDNIIFAGNITINDSDLYLDLEALSVEITGSIFGSYQISKHPFGGYIDVELLINSSNNNSLTPNGEVLVDYSIVPSVDILLYEGGSRTIRSNTNGILQPGETITGALTVRDVATLKGNGTAGGITVIAPARLAPGDSPGCIISTGDLTLGGFYDVELEGTTACTEYDQTQVTGLVDLTGATLNTILFNEYIPTEGDEYIIIQNDDVDAITGEFDSLPEGAEFDVDGVTFAITYTGGDGNDVVLSAVSVSVTLTSPADDPDATPIPGVPDTGVGALLKNPLFSLITLLATASTLFTLRKTNTKGR